MLFHCVNAPYSKWYITGEHAESITKPFAIHSYPLLDITIQCILDNADPFNPTMMDVDFFSSEKGQGEVLHFKKVSSESQEWKHNAAIAL
jgi:hypothetical protein